MLMHIDNDYNRFRQIIKGKIKDNLRKYISNGEMVGRVTGLALLAFGLGTISGAW